jgi:hypothetical protein
MTACTTFMSMIPSCTVNLRQTASSALNRLQDCLEGIKAWMTDNRLKLNPDKTEFMFFGDKPVQSKFYNFLPTNIIRETIFPSNKVKKLGVICESVVFFISYKPNMSILLLPQHGLWSCTPSSQSFSCYIIGECLGQQQTRLLQLPPNMSKKTESQTPSMYSEYSLSHRYSYPTIS